jgi:hypothetical protein
VYKQTLGNMTICLKDLQIEQEESLF